MDVDGTLTDGKIYMSNEGELFKAFDIKDGYGIHDIAIPSGMTPIIITGGSSGIIKNRCKELGITEIYQSVTDKINLLRQIIGEEYYKNTAYIGDDINDLACLKMIKKHHGITGCPADAVSQVKEIADFISVKNGGEGAVREFIEYLLSSDQSI